MGRPLRQQGDWLPLRGRGISYVFQDSLSSFCPVRTLYEQLWDAARVAGMGRSEFAARYFSNDDFSGKRVSRNVRTRIRSSSVIRTSSFRQNNDGSYFSIIDSRLGR